MAEKYNHGTSTAKKGRFTIMDSYGKDDSNWTGSSADERGNSGQGGSVTDLSHSLSGSKANQSGS